MDRWKQVWGAVLVVVAVAWADPSRLQAQDGAPLGPLVGAEWAAAHLNDSDLVILHVGDEEAYAGGHIPGALFVSLMAISDPDSRSQSGLVLELPDPAALELTLERLGISDDSRILVYAGGRSISAATRVMFTLDWAGLGDRAVLLDGGLGAWKTGGGAVTAEVPTVTAGDVTVRLREDLVVDADWVRGHSESEGYTVLDGRARRFYDGEREDRGKAGHIPGAGSLPIEELFGTSGGFKSKTDLRAILAEAGVSPGDTVVAYCHIGQRASTVAFAARMLGHEVKLYDGSWEDWAARGLPAVKAPPGHR
ncbi:MAG: sulfurtransferase [Gemmatimonadetes bacterium]|nr:sulfurtransferase [Gemmatimonadota bacterium]